MTSTASTSKRTESISKKKKPEVSTKVSTHRNTTSKDILGNKTTQRESNANKH